MNCKEVFEQRTLYRFYDPDPSRGGGMQEVSSWSECDDWNDQDYGIFWSVNAFDGPRKIENCKKILSWIIDIDDGSKKDQHERIMGMKLLPSEVVETKRGYHMYFNAINAEKENYRDIEERLIEAYGGDTNAKDLCRVLRVPYFFHCKDPSDRFYVKTIFSHNVKYTEEEIRKFFPRKVEEEKVYDQKNLLRRELKFQKDSDLWERIWELDCEVGLSRLSGTEAVSFEKFSFKRTSSGNLNILVNGKGCSCWIDRHKRIGSSDKGGPTIAQWINWYHRDWHKTVEFIKKYFPEVADGNKRF